MFEAIMKISSDAEIEKREKDYARSLVIWLNQTGAKDPMYFQIGVHNAVTLYEDGVWRREAVNGRMSLHK